MNDMIMVTIIEAMIIVLLQGILLLFPNKKTSITAGKPITAVINLLTSIKNFIPFF